MKLPRKLKKQRKNKIKFFVNGKRINNKHIHLTGIGQYSIRTT